MYTFCTRGCIFSYKIYWYFPILKTKKQEMSANKHEIKPYVENTSRNRKRAIVTMVVAHSHI